MVTNHAWAFRLPLSLVLLATLASSESSIPHVWASVTPQWPVFTIGQPINVTFAATNLGDLPIRLTALREETILVINGKEWRDSAFAFTNGVHSTEEFLPPGKSTTFSYLLTSLFQKPGVYRIVWRGKDFETLPVEFRVAALTDLTQALSYDEPMTYRCHKYAGELMLAALRFT